MGDIGVFNRDYRAGPLWGRGVVVGAPVLAGAAWGVGNYAAQQAADGLVAAGRSALKRVGSHWIRGTVGETPRKRPGLLERVDEREETPTAAPIEEPPTQAPATAAPMEAMDVDGQRAQAAGGGQGTVGAGHADTLPLDPPGWPESVQRRTIRHRTMLCFQLDKIVDDAATAAWGVGKTFLVPGGMHNSRFYALPVTNSAVS